MLYLLRLILCIIFFASQVVAEDNVSQIMEQARANAEEIRLPVNKYEEEGLKRAEETSKLFHSSAFQERIQREQQRLEKEIFETYTEPWKKRIRQTASEQKGESGSLSTEEKILLFISSSVPDETVHAYVATLDKVDEPNISLVMRGVAGGLTQVRTSGGSSYFSRILKKDLACSRTKKPCERYKVPISLKPSLFTKYGITRVPAVVYEHNGNVFLIQGDSSLDYLLERINREAKSKGVTNLIRKMRSAL